MAFKGHVSSKARIVGDVDDKTRTIAAKKVEVLQDGKWVEVKLPSMM